MDAHTRFDAAAALSDLIGPRLSRDANAFRLSASNEVSNGASKLRLAQLLALASRHVRAGVPLNPGPDELRLLSAGIPGWDMSRWSLLEALRVALLLASPDMEGDAFPITLEHCFRFADHGESCALYRALALLPSGERFVWRAGEGCRSNMRSVFEAVACDSPYPAQHFDEVAWRQLVIKAVFIDVPLWRIDGIDRRLSPELARMALDLADERCSAGRDVPPQLWLCLGPHGGERGLQALRKELAQGHARGQRGALLALARAGDTMSGDCRWLRTALDKHAGFLEQARQASFTQQALRFL
ncbi:MULTISPECIES: EboA domain-containing protein [unclassified Cupriavidus]|uniref:EboA domain-containing protein n=1 Tax=unclassified Cupriavidus TaxID=2640874 RepID=UPI00041F6B76|nr:MULTISPECIES: EboA domain-containing protein [unclassified Cupriavidus]MBP0631185.1 EboA domain-containing protein [Cupriavidus sp. AcVe19-1a]MBP0639286.1 EboA domain-containing protein [Cupriavidus sp. AcVe19-6a]